MAPVLSFKNKDVCHPHGKVLWAADTFFRGVIDSATDFTLYNHTRENGPGMEGIDFAFYQGGQIPHEVGFHSGSGRSYRLALGDGGNSERSKHGDVERGQNTYGLE
jgi:hypothetical protein